MSLRESTFHGFANPVDPRPDELEAWAYHPDSVPLETMPPEWDLLIAGDVLAPTLFDLAMDQGCPARRFALHCMYIYAAEGVRPNATAQRKRRLRKYFERAEDAGDEQLQIWAFNCRLLGNHPDLFNHQDWIEGGLVRNPHRLSPLRRG